MSTESTDEALMTAVRDGAPADLGVLFDRHHRSVYEFFVRMTGDRAQSEELVLDVFDRILKYRDTFRDEGHFRPWLFRLARNTCRDYYRKHPIEIPFPASDVAGLLNLKAESLRRNLLALPEDRRALIVLSQYQHLTPDEMAELFDIDLPEARLRVHRALMELREQFGTLSIEKRHAV